VTIIKKGNVIETVRPAKTKLRTNIKINELNKFDSEELKKHVYSLVANQDDVSNSHSGLFLLDYHLEYKSVFKYGYCRLQR